MKKFTYLSALLLVASTLMFSGCSKEEDPVPPVLTFKTSTGYISSDVAVPYGEALLIGVNAKGNGSDNLIKFQVIANGILLLDSTINTQSFDLELTSVKSILDKEVWKFVTYDLAGNIDADSITITGDFGEINNYASVVLGAQDNTTEKGFLSFSNSTLTKYTQDEAFDHQADIDLFCFYENTATSVNLMTLAAPGSNITGIFTGATSVENYTTKNTTYFTKTQLTPAQFDAVTNDAIILASYDTDNKFRKAKLLTAGEVYAIKLQSGKYGLLKILATSGDEDGTLEFSVKIQK